MSTDQHSVNSLPRDWQQSAALLRDAHGHRVYRIDVGGRSAILKLAADPADVAIGNEQASYALLDRLGVPVLQVLGTGQGWLLLEDLDASPTHRLASEEDMSDCAVGAAVAGWYGSLHRAGRELLAAREAPGFLTRETDPLTPSSILLTARLLGQAEAGVWRLAAESIDALKAQLERLPTTLTYNDFDVGNLALRRELASGRRMAREVPQAPGAVVFDYHLLGIGLAYSDVRNVRGSLRGDAREAFLAAYGPTDTQEELLDRPLSVLVGLHEAARRERLPRWAEPLLQSVMTGQLERDLRALVEYL